jgi:hypothetical protein
VAPPARVTTAAHVAAVEGQDNTFELTAEGPAAGTYDWAFSDGASASGQTVRHIFQGGGSRWASVHLVVESGADAWASAEIGQAPVLGTAAPPDHALVGQAYAFTFTAEGAPGIAFSLAGGALPPGLSLASGGRLAGVPTAPGHYGFAVRAANSAGAIVSDTFHIEVTRKVVVPQPSPTPPPAPTPTPTPTPAVTPPPDRSAPAVSRVKAPTSKQGFDTLVRKQRLATTLSLDEPSSVTVQLLLAKATAQQLGIHGKAVKQGRRRYVVIGTARRARADGRTRLTVKVSRRTAQRLRRQAKLSLLLRVTATDAAGNKTIETKRFTLRGRRSRSA